jgi:DNA modification methylase
VFEEFVRAARLIGQRLAERPIKSSQRVELGDARNMASVSDSSVDAVITSPPYLNAIDYIRGHRLSLVWLGYTVSQLRDVRSGSIGAERSPDGQEGNNPVVAEAQSAGWFEKLQPRHRAMVERYALDTSRLMQEIGRVAKPGAPVVMVVGNSCLRGVYIENSRLIEAGARAAGLVCTGATIRDLPSQHRYLPTPTNLAAQDLSKRMRKECVLSFKKHTAQ